MRSEVVCAVVASLLYCSCCGIWECITCVHLCANSSYTLMASVCMLVLVAHGNASVSCSWSTIMRLFRAY